MNFKMNHLKTMDTFGKTALEKTEKEEEDTLAYCWPDLAIELNNSYSPSINPAEMCY